MTREKSNNLPQDAILEHLEGSLAKQSNTPFAAHLGGRYCPGNSHVRATLRAVIGLCAILAASTCYFKWHVCNPQHRVKPSFPSAPSSLPNASQCDERLNWTTPSTPADADHRYHIGVITRFPLNATELRFLSQGALARGTFNIQQTAPIGQTEADVWIDVYYNNKAALDLLTMCRFHHGDAWGFSVVTPDTSPKLPGVDMSMHVDIYLRLPAIEPLADPLHFGILLTELPWFTHQIYDLMPTLWFKAVWIFAEHNSVHAESLAAECISIRTADASITGKYYTRSILSIETSNAPIAAHAHLLSNVDPGSELPLTAAILRTSNAVIDSKVSLYANGSSTNSGTFSVSAQTTRAPLNMKFVEAPVDSFLALEAGTILSPAHVVLHDTYEGTFELAMSLFPPSVRSPGHSVDPAGRGRSRHVYAERNGSRMRGYARWGMGDAEGKGEVKVTTTLSPLRLDVGEVELRS